MRALFDVIIAAFLLTCTIGSLLVLTVLWLSTSSRTKRPPTHHGSPPRLAALLAAGWLVISAGLIVDGPWGHMTALYVVGIGGVLAIVATVLGMVAAAARDLHRTRLH